MRLSRLPARLLPALLLLIVALAACGPMYDTQYHFTPPADPAGRQMAGQCRMMQNMCLQNCRMEENLCRSEARRQADYEYEAYVRERRRKDAPIKRSRSSFMSTYMCNAGGCENSCENDYRGCYVEAGGRVDARRVCVAFCDELKNEPKKKKPMIPQGESRE